MKSGFSRRKFIAISAAAAGMGLVPFGAAKRATAANLAEWRGLSLGGVATIRIHHSDRLTARTVYSSRVVSEAQRLEAIFSLYRADSALCELNRRGVLVAPPAELADLLGLCDHFWRVTGGVFDPTVQPLWQCYAEHFSTRGQRRGRTRAPGIWKRALRLVGWPKVRFDRDRIVFERRGMALTLNGVAQGYITDRVVDLLREAGLDSCLVDMGEIRTLGRPSGWQSVAGRAAGTGRRRASVSPPSTPSTKPSRRREPMGSNSMRTGGAIISSIRQPGSVPIPREA